jgi:hypothetical protein
MGRQALCSLGLRAKRNETGVFGGVTGKLPIQAPQHTKYTKRNRKISALAGGVDSFFGHPVTA